MFLAKQASLYVTIGQIELDGRLIPVGLCLSCSELSSIFSFNYSKPVSVATSVKQATCIKQAYIHFPKQAKTLKRICINQASVLNKRVLVSHRCLLDTGWTINQKYVFDK